MSRTNPFFEDDLIASIARDTETVQNKQSQSLHAFLKTQTTSNTSVIQSKAKNPLQTPHSVILNSFQDLKNKLSNFNLTQFMSYNFTHLTKFSIAGLALFTILAGGLSAQAFAPDEYKPSQIILGENTESKLISTTECSNTTVLMSTDLMMNTNSSDSYGKYIDIMPKSYQEDSQKGNYTKIENYKNFTIRCYPTDGSITWNDIYSHNLKPQNKGIRSWFDYLYCKFWKKHGVIRTQSYGCVEETTIKKITKEDLPYFTDNFKKSLDAEKIYIKDEDTGIFEKADDKSSYVSQGIQYYVGTTSGEYFNIQISDGEYFKSKVQINLK
jgi:hypothetical protein